MSGINNVCHGVYDKDFIKVMRHDDVSLPYLEYALKKVPDQMNWLPVVDSINYCGDYTVCVMEKLDEWDPYREQNKFHSVAKLINDEQMNIELHSIIPANASIDFTAANILFRENQPVIVDPFTVLGQKG